MLILTKKRNFDRPERIGKVQVHKTAKILGTWYNETGKAHTAKDTLINHLKYVSSQAYPIKQAQHKFLRIIAQQHAIPQLQLFAPLLPVAKKTILDQIEHACKSYCKYLLGLPRNLDDEIYTKINFLCPKERSVRAYNKYALTLELKTGIRGIKYFWESPFKPSKIEISKNQRELLNLIASKNHGISKIIEGKLPWDLNKEDLIKYTLIATQ